MPAARTIAHLSDLHLGRSPRHLRAATALRDAVAAAGADCVVVTGDLTENGRVAELAQFDALFREWHERGELIVIPGNHDCLGDHVDSLLMEPQRADLVRLPGVSVIRVNTTRWFNRLPAASHGTIDRRLIEEVEHLIGRIPPADLVAVALHHHLVPLPVDYFAERVADWLRLPFAAELSLGKVLLNRLQGRVDLVLHGHRHVAWELLWPGEGRPLRVYNAGSSTEAGAFRLFTHRGGELVGPPIWIETAKSPR